MSPEKSGLMVWHDACFLGCRLLACELDGQGVAIRAVAAIGDWYAGASPHADEDGWVRGVRELVVGMRLPFRSRRRAQDAHERLVRWKDAGCLLEIATRFAEQEMVVTAPGRGETVSVRMPAALQDRPAEQAWGAL